MQSDEVFGTRGGPMLGQSRLCAERKTPVARVPVRAPTEAPKVDDAQTGKAPSEVAGAEALTRGEHPSICPPRVQVCWIRL